ncbi:MAG: magnesium transporter MgtE, partial [Chlorobiales bacterium]|nr:magnesium transporter MgtE [Chlorobiales bacterium]
AGMYETTLAQSLVLAFFLTLVLGLGESLSIQSMTMTIQSLHTIQPTLKMYVKSLGREAITTFLIGLSCSLVVCTIVLLWMGVSFAIPVIGGSILLSLMSAGTLGVSIPFLLHALKLDPKIAAGPLTLALADICTLLFYFTMADAFLGAQARAL